MNSKHTSTTTTITDDEVAVIEAELDAALRGKTFDNAHTIRLREIIEELCKESLSYSDDFSDLSCYSSFTKVDRLECLADEEDNTLLSEDILTLQSHSNSPGLGFLTAFCSQENSCSQDVKIKHPLSYMENASQSVVSRFSARQENTTAPFHMEIETQHETQGKDTNQIIPDKKEEFNESDEGEAIPAAETVQEPVKKKVRQTRKTAKENVQKSLTDEMTPNVIPVDSKDASKSKTPKRAKSGRAYRICHALLSKSEYDKFKRSDCVYSRLASQIQYGVTSEGDIRVLIEWCREIESHTVEDLVDLGRSGYLQPAYKYGKNILEYNDYPHYEEDYGENEEGIKKVMNSRIEIDQKRTQNSTTKKKSQRKGEILMN